MSDAINIQNEAIRGSDHYSQISNLLVSSKKSFTLGSVLSCYGDLGVNSLEKLLEIKCDNLELKKNEIINQLDELRSEIFLIKKGWVSLSHSVKNRGPGVCNVYMPGDIVGVRESFFDNHCISILALQDCCLEKISVNDMHDLFRDNEDLKRAVVSYIMVNDNISIERLRSCTHHKAEERVAHFLLEIYARYNFKGLIDSSAFSFPVNQEIVGELLGITNVHVSRCMTALEQKKLIRKSRSTIKLLNPELLAEYTGFNAEMIYGHVRSI